MPLYQVRMTALSAALPTAMLCLALAGCARPADVPSRGDGTSRLVAVDSMAQPPAGKGAAEPFVARTPAGEIVLSWLEKMPDSSVSFRMSTLSVGGTWSAPREVVRRRDLFVNWADFPSVVALADGRLLAHWLQRNGSGKYAYDVRLAQSSNAGETWASSVLPHEAGVQAEHGFVTILPRADSTADVVFLNGSPKPESPASHASEAEHGPPMKLAFARWDARGSVVPATTLDQRVCDCCQTAAAVTAQGPIVAYRDRSEAETRDISVLRRVAGKWTESVPLHRDNWTIDGCPVNGPALSADGDRVAAVWFTGARDTAKVQLVFSTDAGATFGAPVRIDGGSPSGRVDVELLNGGDALVTWLERTGSETAEVRARVVRPDGTAEPHIVVSQAKSSRASGFPRMVRRGSNIVLAWTVAGTPSEIRVATLKVEARGLD
jgi:hypothetical protein